MGVPSLPLAEMEDNAKLLACQIEALQQLNEVGQHCVRPANDFEACLSVIVKAAIALGAAEKCTVQLYDPGADALKLVAHRGFERSFLEFFESVSSQGAACEIAMRMRQRVIVSDITVSGPLLTTESVQVLLAAGVRAVQCTPLISSSGGLLGMISTHYKNPVAPPEWRLTLMDLLARQVADFLERIQTEQALKDSEDQLRRFVDAVPTMIVRFSRDLRLLSANPAAAAFFGFPLAQILGKPMVEIIGPRALEVLRARIDRVLNGENVEFDDEVPYLETGRRYVHGVYSPERDEQGQVVGWVASLADLTEFHQLRERVARVETLAAAGNLASSLAHEINNPLNAVINCLYLLQSGTDAGKTQELLQSASSELARVERIVRQSLSYYRVGAKPQMVDLALLVSDSLQVFDQKCRTAQVRIFTKLRPLPRILSNPDELRQVIDNLLLNALEAMPDGGTLTIAHRAAPSPIGGKLGVHFTIADTGCGIGPEARHRIFEPFFSTKAEKGTGLGLWIVNGILAKHGATIRVRSSCGPGRTGTVVSLAFPA